jgi:uncharacterized phage infection (PIP) family protein YhgE
MEFADGQQEIADGQQKFADGQQKFADGQQKIADGQQKNADGQQKIADDQKTLPTRLDRPLELQISQDMQLEDGWRVHDDDHKLNGWNVLGPDLPGEQMLYLVHVLQSTLYWSRY